MADLSSLTNEQRAIVARMRQQHACLYALPGREFDKLFKRVRDGLRDSREKKDKFLARIAKGDNCGAIPHAWSERPSEANRPRYILTPSEMRRTVLLPMTLRVAMSYYRVTISPEIFGPAIDTGRTGITLDVDGDRMVIRMVEPENGAAHIPPGRLRDIKARRGRTAWVICERIATAIADAFGIFDVNSTFLVRVRPTVSPYEWELTGPIDISRINPFDKYHEAW